MYAPAAQAASSRGYWQNRLRKPLFHFRKNGASCAPMIIMPPAPCGNAALRDRPWECAVIPPLFVSQPLSCCCQNG
jgi:hypothetical protein